MNSLFGRSKSKPRNLKGGSLKDRIGNPTPIDPIRINGSFIDLKLNPQDGCAANGAGVPPLPPLPPIMTRNSPEEDEEEDDASITSDDQSHPPTRPRQDDGNTQVQKYLRGGSHGRQEREEFDHDVSNRSRSNTGEGNPEYGLPFLNFAMCQPI
jgi:hypothetical protein